MPAANMNQQNQEATRFEVRIHFREKDAFRTGMSVTADIETRYRTNALTVPIQCVTTRILKKPKDGTSSTNAPGGMATANAAEPAAKTSAKERSKDRGDVEAKAKAKEEEKKDKPVEVVFVLEGDKVKAVPVKRGISDDDYVEIESGLAEGQEIVSGGYKAISRDLEDGMVIKKGEPEAAVVKKP